MPLSRAVPVLTVDDLRAAVATYRAVVGVDVLMDHGWIVTLGSADSGAQFSLMEADLTAPVTPSASLQVEDVDVAHAAAVAAGLEIVHGPTDEEWGVRRFFLRDAAGNVVNVLAHAA
jgi:predicted enzyme related to lactoylglutathione lyase